MIIIKIMDWQIGCRFNNDQEHKMKFYAAINTHDSENSVGFANTWQVFAFNNRVARDVWVEAERSDGHVSARPVLRCEIGDYIGRPVPFSGERTVIYSGLVDYDDVDGMIGEVQVDQFSPFDVNGYIEPLY